MSLYAPFSLSGLLNYQVQNSWNTSEEAHTTHRVVYSPSTATFATGRRSWFASGRYEELPSITVEDTSLDVTLNDRGSSLRTPAKRLYKRLSLQSPVSSNCSWLDDSTLTSTPRLSVSAKANLASSELHPLLPTASWQEPQTPDRNTTGRDFLKSLDLEPCPPIQRKGKESPCTLDASQVQSTLDKYLGALVADETQSWAESSPRAVTNAILMSPKSEVEGRPDDQVHNYPPQRKPKLRRSNGEDDLRTLYCRSASIPVADQESLLSFEEELTLAILSEMERNPNRFRAHHKYRSSVSGHAPISFGPAKYSKTVLDTLGSMFKNFSPPMTRVF